MGEPRLGSASLTDRRRLDPRIRVVWRVQLAISALTIVVPAFAAVAVADLPPVVAVAVALVAALAVWWVPDARWRHWSFALEPTTLELRSGIFWRSESSLPYFRVQHVEIERGPIERRLGLAQLRMKTAASSGTANLPGVAAAEADELRRTILERAGGDDAV